MQHRLAMPHTRRPEDVLDDGHSWPRLPSMEDWDITPRRNHWNGDNEARPYRHEI